MINVSTQIPLIPIRYAFINIGENPVYLLLNNILNTCNVSIQTLNLGSLSPYIVCHYIIIGGYGYVGSHGHTKGGHIDGPFFWGLNEVK